MRLYLDRIDKQNKLKLEAGKIMSKSVKQTKAAKPFKPGYYATGEKITFPYNKADHRRRQEYSRRMSAWESKR